MSDCPPTRDVVASSAIPKGYVRVGNCDFRLNVYNDLNLGARPALDKELTAQMTTLNLKKFSGDTGEYIFRWLNAATAHLRGA